MSVSRQGGDYYAVHFLDGGTTVVVLVDAEDGYFKEASWTPGSTAYPPVSRKAAESLVRQEMEEMGLDTRQLDQSDFQLVHHRNPYFPNWEVSAAGHTFVVGQDGIVSVK